MKQPIDAPVETPVQDAADAAGSARPLIDIRTPAERQLGVPAGAVWMSDKDLLRRCREDGLFGARGGFVLCSEGLRSKETVMALRGSGFKAFSSVAGGFSAWRDLGLPVTYPAGMDSAAADRYARHLVMPQIGAAGQQRLRRARILLAGLGGLNSPVALYLAAAGVGTLGLLDFDTVERSNLQRQILHGEQQLGEPKVRSASERLRDLNPDVETVNCAYRVTAANAGELVEPWDIVVDGTDSFAARYALNDACVSQRKPLVYGAVMRFQGQVSVFWPAATNEAESPCFRCLFPNEPSAADAPGCAEAGVLGILPGIIGTLQATEALKLVLGIGQPLTGRLLMVDALNTEFRQMRIPVATGCPSCGSQRP